MIAQSRTTISLLVLAPILLLRESVGAPRSRLTSASVFPARNCGAGRVQLLLLPRDRSDFRWLPPSFCNTSPRYGCCSTWWRAGCSVPTVRRSLGVAAGGSGLCFCRGRGCRPSQLSLAGSLGSALQHDWCDRRGAGGHLLRVLQRLRATPAADLLSAGPCWCTRFSVRPLSGLC